jgi:hypothetical protein
MDSTSEPDGHPVSDPGEPDPSVPGGPQDPPDTGAVVDTPDGGVLVADPPSDDGDPVRPGARSVADGTQGGPDDSDGTGDGHGDRGPGWPAMTLIDDPAHPGRSLAELVSWVVVGLACLGVLWSLHPEWIIRTTTPTGGDMGAHVWGPDYLKDHLLPQFRLTGWSPDWYAGFPAFVFYMVIPMLGIVMIDAGPPWWATPFLLAAVAAAAVAVHRRVASPVLRTFLWVCLGVVAVLSVGLPYEVAFKMVAVSGLVAMPLGGFALGRAARLPFPGPPLIALGAAAFIYETGYTILGGNIPSTMAGEFAFSISLALSLLYLAVVWRGMRNGRDRALGAVLFGLVVLCHLIPAIFAVIATVVLVVTRREDREPWWDASSAGRWVAGVVVGAVLVSLWLAPAWFPLVGTAAAVALFVSVDVRVLRWAAVVGPVGFLAAAFWFVPFYGNSRFLNDMGWEKYTEYAPYLWPDPAKFDMPFRNVVFALAALGILLSLVHRVRLGWYLTLVMISMAWIFRFLPQYRLWNARILPFYYLVLYLLAALGVALVIRSIALVVGDLQRRREEPVGASVIGTVVACVVLAVAIGGSLWALPGGRVVADAATGGTAFRWLGISFPKQNISSGWALYNFQGMEQREAWPEFQAVVQTMAEVGERDGCGRAMWEYESALDRFGTPMAPMLLPYFTDGCIGSMEGLYFEASSTTPFHFINQSELSISPSRAQRDLPYPSFDIQQGISHLQMLGVRYYLTTSPSAADAARSDPRLREVASTGPWSSDGQARTWTVFQVAGSELVRPLEYEPVVLTDADDHIDGWVYGERAEPLEGQTLGQKTAGPAMEWYLDLSRRDVPIATNGPADWPRAASDSTDWPRVPVEDPPTVTDVRSGNDTISFRVSRPGTPVLVRTSYFPNWDADGAEGPWRVSPNLMVVVPTDDEVTLRFGTTWVDWLAWIMAVAGFVAIGWLAVSDQRRKDAGTGPDDDVHGAGSGSDGTDPRDGAAEGGVDTGATGSESVDVGAVRPGGVASSPPGDGDGPP